jgi:hypothetical protein
MAAMAQQPDIERTSKDADALKLEQINTSDVADNNHNVEAPLTSEETKVLKRAT